MRRARPARRLGLGFSTRHPARSVLPLQARPGSGCGVRHAAARSPSEWHARIAAALEERLPDTAAARPELLAHHWTEAGRASQAVGYWIAAGDRALGRAGHHEAAAFFGHALAAVGAQEETPETLTAIIDLRRQLHQALYPLGQLQHARANLAEAERAAERLGEPVRLSRVLSSQIYLLATAGDLAGAVAAGDRVLTLLAQRDDFEAAVNTRLMLARALYAAGRYGEAVGRAREAVARLGDDVDRGAAPGMNQTVSARVWLALCHAERGEFAAGAAEGNAAMRLAAHPRCSEHDVLWSRVGVGRLRVVSGDLTGTIEALAPALPLCEGDHAIYLSRVAASLGAAYAGTGRIEEGVALLQRADEQAQAIGFAFGHALVLAQLGGVLLLAGDPDRAREAGLRAVDAAQRWGERGNEAWAFCLLGDAAAARRDRREGETRYLEALAIAGQLGMAPVRARPVKVKGVDTVAQHARFDDRLCHLLDEQRHSVGPGDDLVEQRLGQSFAAGDVRHDRLCGGAPQPVQRQPGDHRMAAERGDKDRTSGDHHENACALHAVERQLDQLQCRRIDPMRVLDHPERRLAAGKAGH